MARAYAEQDQYEPARAAYREVLSGDPGNRDVLVEYAVLEAQAGQATAARQAFEKALDLAPDDASVLLNLGELAHQEGNLDAAAGHYRHGLETAPKDADLLYGLGDVLRAQGRPADALPYLENAQAEAPDDPEILNALAIVFEALNRLNEAIAYYRQAVSLAPDYCDAWINLGHALFQANAFEEAESVFRKAQNIQALPTEALVGWARVLFQLGRYDEGLARADDAMKRGDAPSIAHFARGLFDLRLGNFAAAGASFKASITHDRTAAEAYEQLAYMNALEPEAAGPLADILNDNALSEQSRASAGFALYKLLDRQGCYEQAFTVLAQANAFKAKLQPFNISAFAQRLHRTSEVFSREFFAARGGQGVPSKAPIFILGMPRSGTTLTEQILAGYEPVRAGGERQDFQKLARSIGDYPNAALELPTDWACWNGERILEDMMGGDRIAHFATNKSPGNYTLIGLIAWVFPNARIIYCKRDPRETGFSCFEQNFRSGLNFSYDLEAFGQVYRHHQRLMDHWREVCPVAIHTVSYDDMTNEPENTARALIEYCGLEWNPACLDTASVDRAIDTASVWQVRQPINTRSLGRWRRYEAQLQPMIHALGL